MITPYRNRCSPKLMEICQIKPYTSINDYFVPFFLLLVDINMIVIYHQHGPDQILEEPRFGLIYAIFGLTYVKGPCLVLVIE